MKYVIRVIAAWLGLYLLVPVLLLVQLAKDALRSGTVSDWTVVLVASVVAMGALAFIAVAAIAIYSADGKRLTEWGSAGTGPAQFRLPHSIEIDEGGVIYVSDRENGRIQRFDLKGKYLGEWPNLGRIFSLKVSAGAIWLATQPLELPNLSPGWILKLDRATGKVLGYVEITGGHGVEVLDNGEVMVGPGPNGAASQWFRPTS